MAVKRSDLFILNPNTRLVAKKWHWPLLLRHFVRQTASNIAIKTAHREFAKTYLMPPVRTYQKRASDENWQRQKYDYWEDVRLEVIKSNSTDDQQAASNQLNVSNLLMKKGYDMLKLVDARFSKDPVRDSVAMLALATQIQNKILGLDNAGQRAYAMTEQNLEVIMIALRRKLYDQPQLHQELIKEIGSVYQGSRTIETEAQSFKELN